MAPHPSAVVVSPHLDDAAFSAASRAMTPGTLVVTVYAGDPPPLEVAWRYRR